MNHTEKIRLSSEAEQYRFQLQNRVALVSNAYFDSTYKFFKKLVTDKSSTLDFPNDYSELSEAQKSLFWGIVKQYFPEDYADIPEQESTTIVKNGEISFDNSPDNRVYLASVSKTAIAALFEEVTKSLGKDTVTGNAGRLLGDIVSRSQGELIDKDEFFKKIIRDIYREVYKSDFDAQIKIENGESNESRLIGHIFTSFYDAKTKSFKEPVKTLLEQYEIPVSTILALSLKYSANFPIQICREFLIQELGGEDKYAEELSKKVDGYSPTKGHHWMQDDANIGYLKEFALLQDQLSRDPSFAQMKSLMENNEVFPEPFFDFSNSETGRALREKGYKIIEKTGYYDGVHWVLELAKRGLPIHLAFATVVTIIDPDGNVVGSFSHGNTVGLIVPEGIKSEDEDFNGESVTINYPAYEAQSYQKYMRNIYAKKCWDFRAELEAIWNEHFEAA